MLTARIREHALQDQHFLLRETREGPTICAEDLLAALGVGEDPQAIREGLRDDSAQVDASRAIRLAVRSESAGRVKVVRSGT